VATPNRGRASTRSPRTESYRVANRERLDHDVDLIMQVTSIRSTQNPKVKNLVKLRDGHYRRRVRRYLVEGCREIRFALAHRAKLAEIYFSPEFFRDRGEDAVLSRAESAGIPLFRLSREAFAKAAYRERPDGLLGLAVQHATPLEAIELSVPPLLLIVERVEKPGNLGGLLRTADAAGCDAVIVTDPVTDIFNPNVIRASQGAFFSVAIAVTENAPALEFLRGHDIGAFATSPSADRGLWAADLRGAAAIVLGSEQDGLSPFWIEQADQTVAIPMSGDVDSLNISVSAAIMLFEAVRQRTERS
jgi:TrmH family RNA methyltransferase